MQIAQATVGGTVYPSIPEKIPPIFTAECHITSTWAKVEVWADGSCRVVEGRDVVAFRSLASALVHYTQCSTACGLGIARAAFTVDGLLAATRLLRNLGYGDGKSVL